MASEKKKKLKNIVKGEHSSKINAVSHPKGQYLKYGGYDENEVFDHDGVVSRGRVTDQNQKTPAQWKVVISDPSAIPRLTTQKAYIHLGRVYRASDSSDVST